ncbi:MAG: hypothetical protein CMO30_15125 [Tistrella sp.]|uniref:hypothetical protein n=1 Tax=Tistrella sp. TaxID=2024861 RepID=UPI000C37D7D6|nr:hypothetical protein [Tistrella sp.]MAD38581.1 hypothetical protein [Tistrella sp.]MBA75359.1 hypothetical protein [Tistrella sp.]MBA76600.1 hypothetical protein [Tistrella sp.]
MEDELDFSELSDDQIIALLRSLMREASRRNPAAQKAAEQVVITEAERHRAMQCGGTAEAAALRAQDRAAAVEAGRQLARAEYERRVAAGLLTEAHQARQMVDTAATLEREAEQDLLRAVAVITGHKPSEISIVCADTRKGRRVMVNLGHDRFQPDHLADYNVDTKRISVKRHLMPAKKTLIEILAKMGARQGDYHLRGDQFDWR